MSGRAPGAAATTTWLAVAHGRRPANIRPCDLVLRMMVQLQLQLQRLKHQPCTHARRLCAHGPWVCVCLHTRIHFRSEENRSASFVAHRVSLSSRARCAEIRNPVGTRRGGIHRSAADKIEAVGSGEPGKFRVARQGVCQVMVTAADTGQERTGSRLLWTACSSS